MPFDLITELTTDAIEKTKEIIERLSENTVIEPTDITETTTENTVEQPVKKITEQIIEQIIENITETTATSENTVEPSEIKDSQ